MKNYVPSAEYTAPAKKAAASKPAQSRATGGNPLTYSLTHSLTYSLLLTHVFAGAKAKVAYDKNAPKKAKSAKDIYVESNRSKIKEENPSYSTTEVTLYSLMHSYSLTHSLTYSHLLTHSLLLTHLLTHSLLLTLFLCR